MLESEDDPLNKRIYYAIQAVAAEPVDSDGKRLGKKIKLQGLQSISLNTDFEYEPIPQFGSLALYDQVRTESNIEIQLSKIIDNKPPLYLLLTQGSIADSSKKNIYDLGPRKSDIYLGIWKDTNSFASGVPIQTVRCSGMSISSMEYNLTVDSFSETITLQGNSKVWLEENLLEPQNPQDGSRYPEIEPPECPGNPLCIPVPNRDVKPDNVVVAQRHNIDFSGSTLPTGQGGIYGTLSDIRIVSINIKCDIDREKIYQIGSAVAAHNYIINPTTINCSIETLMSHKEFEKFHEYQNEKYIASLVEDQSKHPVQYDIAYPFDEVEGFQSSDPAPCTYSGTKIQGPNGNLNFCTTEIPKHTFPKSIIIKIKNCNNISKKTQTDTDDLYINLGNDNRMSSIDYAGNTSGDNIIVRYNFKNYNMFAIEHNKVALGGRFDVSVEPL